MSAEVLQLHQLLKVCLLPLSLLHFLLVALLTCGVGEADLQLLGLVVELDALDHRHAIIDFVNDVDCVVVEWLLEEATEHVHVHAVLILGHGKVPVNDVKELLL